ncbi:hypothetical protein HETIRDRAFT_420117 [Heterobasidion irregulare TC 32-1]|uniref:Uncharacterized protein n=1 Tax=Heterobasidion irregulare (strain TC 32-1) TaxID=747525 RepID=W4JZD5_HETIT|nr:uncharacterized protein HETIRDRAFT_420117 [Heterobasidion irregulare TC 32-1]ETW78907.1 hypothetical protein HETIRDRAFT_420117 [Heterobasidion irregulare TC 32-1]
MTYRQHFPEFIGYSVHSCFAACIAFSTSCLDTRLFNGEFSAFWSLCVSGISRTLLILDQYLLIVSPLYDHYACALLCTLDRLFFSRWSSSLCSYLSCCQVSVGYCHSCGAVVLPSASFIICSGQVHCLCPICGASLGAYLTETIPWLVGMLVSPDNHWKRWVWCEVSAYILLSHDMVPVWDLKVNCLVVEKICRHSSWRFRADLSSLRAIVVSLLSGLVGARSIGSSTKLKSPSIMSGLAFVFSICM